MLEPVHDIRRGDRLEIVVATFNEAARIGLLVRYYAPRFDIVLLDDDSADDTVTEAVRAGASVFRRTVKDIPPEAHLAYYVNTLSKSGRCFWMLADEYVPQDAMAAIDTLLREGAGSVFCTRLNYFFAHRVQTLTSVLPRGFCRGGVRYEPENLHASLRVLPVEGKLSASARFDVYHCHVWTVRSYFGTAGAYAYAEVQEFRKMKRPAAYFRFFRRFVVSFWAYLLLKWWRETHLPFSAKLILAVERGVILSLASMSWLEQAYLPTAEQQQAFFARFFESDAAPVLAPAALGQERP